MAKTKTEIKKIEPIEVPAGRELAYWATMAFLLEKPRVATQVSISHLARTHRFSPTREAFLEILKDTEKYADKKLADSLEGHPAWEWGQHVIGVGRENLGKVVGLVEAFGRFYDLGDPMIPVYVKQEPEAYYTIKKSKREADGLLEIDETIEEMTGVWVEGIERLANISKLWKYAGLDVGPEGAASRRQKGQLLGFNSDLRMALYRLGMQLLRNGKRADSVWFREYVAIRAAKEQALKNQGIALVAAPKARICAACLVEVKARNTLRCPICGEKLGKKVEKEDEYFISHLHMHSLRVMIKRFSACMWLVWRAGLNLPVTQPYAIAKLGHTTAIDPWKMVDR